MSAADDEGLLALLRSLPGSLTATVWCEPADAPLARRLLLTAARMAGRVLCNGAPTGVAVTRAEHHGGPYPATLLPHLTSVGAAAIDRFLRPVVYQDVPPELLPAPLRSER